MSTADTNRLIFEKSPYLLQHAHSPVDWYPWGNEAFCKAKSEDKPIFLSIGYSTCHWCHVMEKECFEDDEVAALLNRHFTSIKVDKEERPDIDAVYMAVCQALTGQGGWPMTILMTAEQKPFFAGTYLPKHSHYGMTGLIDLLDLAYKNWNTERNTLITAGEDIRLFLHNQQMSHKGKVTKELIKKAVIHFKQSFDEENGGFGTSPKFPSPHNLFFLLRIAQVEKDDMALQMVEKTLQQMARGGIFDHIGGGFCRYSTDDYWLAPHFEKMLYDNALLVLAYLEAFQITRKPFYREVVKRTLDYVLSEMTDIHGGFYSAQDADSDGKEGEYYVFTPEEIFNVLGEKDGKEFCNQLDITLKGNFEGKNIPNRLRDKDYYKPMPATWLDKLQYYRKQRMSLHTDDKILTAWNGLMIAAFAKAYAALEDDRYLAASQRAASFVLDNMTKNGYLCVWYRDGQSGGNGHLDDYAFMVWALLELYNATFEPTYLEQAVRLNEQQMSGFFDNDNGGFYLYSSQSEQLILRPKEVYDGAIPSGNSVASVNLIRLSRLTGNLQLDEWVRKQLEFVAGQIYQFPSGYSFSLIAVMLVLYSNEIVVCVLPNEKAISQLRRLINTTLRPQLSVVIKTPKNASLLEAIAPFTKVNMQINGQQTFYICKNHTCSPPICGIEEFKKTFSSIGFGNVKGE